MTTVVRGNWITFCVYSCDLFNDTVCSWGGQKLYEWKLMLTTLAGKPKTRWENDIKGDWIIMKTNDLTKRIQDRVKWKEIVEKVKTCKQWSCRAWRRRRKWLRPCAWNRMVGWQLLMNWQGCGRERSRLRVRATRHLFGELENYKNESTQLLYRPSLQRGSSWIQISSVSAWTNFFRESRC